MKAIQPYLNFDGTTRDAMTFYHSVIGGDLHIQSFADAKMDGPPDRIIHSTITNGSAVLMASDSMPGQPVVVGTNSSVCIDCTSAEEVHSFYNGMSAGGKAEMPVQDTFWGATFGMCADKYGVQWMFNYTKPQQ